MAWPCALLDNDCSKEHVANALGCITVNYKRANEFGIYGYSMVPGNSWWILRAIWQKSGALKLIK